MPCLDLDDEMVQAADQARLAGLVDHHAADQVRGILVVLGGAVVVRGGLLDTIERADAEVGGKTADGDLLVAAVDALAGDAGQARQGIGDADVRELADVLGHEDFDQGGVVLLGFGGGLQAARKAAGDLELLELDHGTLGIRRRRFVICGGHGFCVLGGDRDGRGPGEQAGSHKRAELMG